MSNDADNPQDQYFYNVGWQEAIEMVLEVIEEMQYTYNYHNPTLDELEQRIV